jgi:hypothetical protein
VVGGIVVLLRAQNGSETDAILPLVERWSRGRWSIQQTPTLRGAAPIVPGGAPGRGSLGDVSCTSTTACTAVGSGVNGPLVERWTGRKWAIQRSATSVRGGLQLVSCVSNRECVAIGQAGNAAEAEQWNGARWSRQPIPSKGFLTNFASGSIDGLSCGSKTACLALGSWSSSCPSSSLAHERCTQGGLLWRWNGSRWSLQVQRNPKGWFSRAVSCVRSESVCIDFGAAGGMRLWNGVHSLARSAPSFPGVVGDPSCTSVTACMAVGWVGGTRSSAWRWNGKRWIDVSPRTPARAPAA